MKIGDVIVYANGERATIESFPKVNGSDGIMVKPGKPPLFPSDVFIPASKALDMIAAGIWHIESKEAQPGR